MKAKKIALLLLIIIPLALIAIGVFVTINLNEIVTQTVETTGSSITQTEVTLQKSDISIITGEGSLQQLSIANPKGFSDNNIFTLGRVSITLDTESLATDTVIIKSLIIDAPAIRYEVNETSSNLKKLVNTVKQAVPPATDNSSGEHSDKKIIIDKLVISNGDISIVAPLVDKPLNAALPTLTLEGIGREEGGTEPVKAMQLVMNELSTAILAAATPALNDLREKLGIKLDGETKGLVNTIKDKAGELSDKVKGLFK